MVWLSAEHGKENLILSYCCNICAVVIQHHASLMKALLRHQCCILDIVLNGSLWSLNILDSSVICWNWILLFWCWFTASGKNDGAVTSKGSAIFWLMTAQQQWPCPILFKSFLCSLPSASTAAHLFIEAQEFDFVYMDLRCCGDSFPDPVHMIDYWLNCCNTSLWTLFYMLHAVQ